MTADPPPQLYTVDDRLSRAGILRELAAMPRLLTDALRGQAPAALLRGPGRGEWPAFGTVKHVRDAALVYGLRFRFIVLDNNPLLPNYDEDNWVAASKDRVEDIASILAEIRASRSGLMRLLRRLDESDWSRTGRHEILGPVVLEAYVRHQVAHERMHLAQVRAALPGDAGRERFKALPGCVP